MLFTELPYNSIFTWNQLRDVFLARYYPVSTKLNHKDRVNNFVALPGQSVSSSWDRFTSFLRSVPNHRIDDESLEEYFYRGQDDNNKAVLDTIAGGYYGECPYAEIAEKLEKISRNNKARSNFTIFRREIGPIPVVSICIVTPVKVVVTVVVSLSYIMTLTIVFTTVPTLALTFLI